MARNKEGKLQNVKASLEKYVHDNIVCYEDIRVNFEGIIFENDNSPEWVSETILALDDKVYHRGVDVGVDGQTCSVALNFNIFVVKEKTKKTNRHYEIRDVLADYFYIGKLIPMYDFSNDDFENIIQYLKIREVDTDEPILDQRKYWIYNYMVFIDWQEKWDRE